MTGKVLNEGEVYLNGEFYPIEGRVRRSLTSQFPNKIITGDYTYDNEMNLSNWIINDQRGGQLIEEMDITKDAKRYYWSSLDVSHKGNMLLPPLATSISPPAALVAITGNSDPDTLWTNETNVYDGDLTTSATCALPGAIGWGGYLVLTFSSATLTGIWIRVLRSNANVNNMEIDYSTDGSSWTNAVTQDPDCTSSKDIGIGFAAASGITQIRIRFYNSAAVGGYTVNLYELQPFATAAISTMSFCNFNSNTYYGINRVLSKLNSSTGATLTPVYYFSTNITDLVSTIGSQMAILLGDSTAFQYMSTAEVFAATDETGAYYGVDWSAKFGWIDSSGQFSYCTAFANPLIETDNGLIDCPGGYVKGLGKYIDANGNPIIYAHTRTGLYAHDYANAKFLLTGATWADNANVGRACEWNGAYWIPVGQDVVRYTTGDVATVSHQGLAQDDGLVQWDDTALYISALIPGEYYIYAPTHTSGAASLTGLYKTNGSVWYQHYIGSTTAKSMHAGIISSVYASRLWFDYNDLIYYIAEQATNMCPKKISSYTYADDADGYMYHVTSWYNAGTAIFPKLAKRIQLYTDDCSANETIQVLYQIDHSGVAIASGWTSLGTISADGVTEYTFGTNGVGVAFKAIRFQFKFVRGSTNTNSPNLRDISFSYMKILNPTWAWQFTVNCTGGRKSSKQLEDALVTAAETQTLLEFTYRSDEGTGQTHYVKIAPMNGLTPTGKNHDAKYRVTVIEP